MSRAHDAITIIKDMDYRGVKEEWSNTYTLNGTTPTTDASWKTLADAVIASEKQCYVPAVRVIRAMGYASGTDAAVWSWDYLAAATPVAGLLAINGSNDRGWAGDQAGWLRMRVGSSESGKPKYIRKYFHGGSSQIAVADSMTTQCKTMYVEHAGRMVDGTLPGSMRWIGPDGTVGTAPAASVFVTTRTLKRRGRRPTPAQ